MKDFGEKQQKVNTYRIRGDPSFIYCEFRQREKDFQRQKREQKQKTTKTTIPKVWARKNPRLKERVCMVRKKTRTSQKKHRMPEWFKKLLGGERTEADDEGRGDVGIINGNKQTTGTTNQLPCFLCRESQTRSQLLWPNDPGHDFAHKRPSVQGVPAFE